MQRNTKFILVAIILIVYIAVPFGSVLDSLLYYGGYKQTTPYLIINVWEATLFMFGLITGIGLMKRDLKKDKK